MRLRRVLGRVAGHAMTWMGPGYAKVGQILSTRKDLLPADLCNGMADVVVGRGTRAGSVALVHRTVDAATGADLARKTLRPRASAVLHRNLATLQRFAKVAACLPVSRGIPIVEMCADISTIVSAQTDLVQERRSLERLRSMLDPVSVHVPYTVDGVSPREALHMEWIDVDPDLAMSSLGPQDRDAVITVLVQSLLRMIFIEGFFHCDLHPGNWWPLGSDRIAIVDAGFMYELTPVQQWHFIEFFYGMAFGDGEHAFRHMVATADPDELPSEQKMKAMEREVVELVEAQYDASVTDFDLATFGGQLFQIQRRHAFRGDTSFIFPLIALLTIEGQLKEFSPGLDFQGIARRELGRPLLALRAENAHLLAKG